MPTATRRWASADETLNVSFAASYGGPRSAFFADPPKHLTLCVFIDGQ